MIGNDKKVKKNVRAVSLIFLKISVNELSSWVKDGNNTSKIFSLRPSETMAAQRVVISDVPVRNTGFIPIKVF